MILNRRNFLQKSGLGLLTLGSLTNNILIDKYAQNLAQSTTKKLALLIGINQYPNHQLYGCLTDVELQKELLIYRFGFKPQDIITLTDNQATKENIENTFLSHIINQVKNDDIVLVHFSGFGRKINVKDLSSEQILTNINSIIPHDGILLAENQNFANDIILDTLLNLGNSLATDKLTMVLDTSFENNQISISKNLSFRSYIQENIVTISKENLVISNDLKKHLNNNFQLTLKDKKNLDSILFASKKGVANEIVSNKFNAGLFTYLLTQYLWASIPPNNLIFTLAAIDNQKSLFTSQIEDNTIELNSNKNSFPYDIFPQKSLAGQALVTEIAKDNFINLDLIGLPLQVLINYGINSVFTNKKDALNINKISIISRDGFKAKATIIDSNFNINKGDIFREFIRVLPRNIGLKIALSDQLARIEKVDATSSLSSINLLNSVINIGDDFADCIIGKSIDQQNSLESYALFSPMGILLPKTMGNIPNEAVSTAVTRFIPQLHILLAKKLLHLTLNQGSSLLPISVSLEIKKDKFQQVINKETFGSKLSKITQQNDNYKLTENLFSKIPIDSKISLKITNYSEENIYFILLNINSFDKISAYLLTENNPIESHQTINISKEIDYLNLALNTNKNYGELILITSSFPFKKILTKIDNSSDVEVAKIQTFLAIANPVKFCLDILEDLHSNSQVNSSNVINNLTDVYALDVNKWASFNFISGI